MLGGFFRIHPTIFAALFLAAWAWNAFALHSPVLGGALLGAWLLLCGSQLGRRAAPVEHASLRLPVGIWLLLSGVMIAGAATYYAWQYPPGVAYVVLLLSVPVSLLLGRGAHRPGLLERWSHALKEAKSHHAVHAALGATGISLFFLALLFRSFADAATTDPIRSLWLVVSPSAFLCAFVAFALLAALLVSGRSRALAIPLACAALFVFLSASVLVFPIGSGFDPFIHRATVSHVVEQGSISPKPLYYVGQYALELFLVHGFSLPIDLVDFWLLPALASLLLIPAAYGAAAHLLRDRPRATAALTLVFLLPLSSFITTTPQGLANLWTLLFALFAVPTLMGLEPAFAEASADRRPRMAALTVGAVATAAIHPIAGLPALVFLALGLAHSLSFTSHKTVGRVAFWLIALAGSIVLPAAFVVNAIRSGTGSGFDLSSITPSLLLSSLHLGLFFQNGFRPLLDFAELWAHNGFLVLLLVALLGAWKLRRDTTPKPYLVMAGVLGVNYLLLSTAVDFSFLIDYERQNYAARLVPLIAFFLTPCALAGAGIILGRVRVSPVLVRAFTVLLTAALMTAALYVTYPRHDAFVVGHGINVSQGDVNAVYEIERRANGRPYLVLANQSVSAAAIRSLGFTHYYGNQFYYPIPTGSDLYQAFLAMNDTPTKETALSAFDIVNDICVSGCMRELPTSVFFAVNRYWWQSDRIVEQAKATADDWFSVDDGTVTVFRYDAPTPEAISQ
ncbi:hypothetical protein EPO34_00130 [Patescibacteria group bacterium]|nr:MAG: hypothetical protein EPO34_00130 [Patescibacteria group bacterium]